MKNVIVWNGESLGCLAIIVMWILIAIAYSIISAIIEVLAPVLLWALIIGLILSIPFIIITILDRPIGKPKGRLFGVLGAVILALGMIIDGKWGTAEKQTRVHHSFLWLINWTEDVSENITTSWHTVGLALGYVGVAIILVGGFFGLKAILGKVKQELAKPAHK